MAGTPRYAKPAGCQGCSLETAGWGWAPAVGPLHSRTLYIGEALGGEEAIAGEPFYGAAGGVLSRVLVRAGIDRNHVRIHNVVNCFPGDTLVAAQSLRGAYRRHYNGTMVTITTDTGVLTSTPNHPVLTGCGWVAAGEIVEGDDLVDGRIVQRVRPGDPHIERPPIRIEEVFDALAHEGTAQRIVQRDVDFHGDGRDGKVEVVMIDRQLWDGIEPALPQATFDYIFKASDVNTGDLQGSCARRHAALDLATAWYAAARSIVSSRLHSFTITPGGPLPAQTHSLAAGADWDAGSLQQLMQSLLPDAELVSQSRDAVPVSIQPARVVKVERFGWSGHVYNLATVSEQYTAGGFIVHNCRPPNDYLVGAPWEHHAISQCRQYLQPTIDQLPTDGVIIPLGATALKSILNLHGAPGIAVKDFAGTISRSPDGRHWVAPTFHPSHLQRGAMNLLDIVTEDVKQAERISREGFVRSACELVVDPDLDYFRAWVTAHLAKVAADPDGVWLAADTEFEGKPDDESEAHVTGGVTLTRFNCANSISVGLTVPYVGEFIREIERLLAGLARLRGIALLWFKYADWVPLAAAGHTLDGIEAYDLAALWHHIQSDLPMGLGFVAARASDFGPWKHWSKIEGWFGKYAAADSVQTFRVGVWLIAAAIKLGMWEMFVRDWHERDQYCLRPAHVGGVPIDRPELEQFHKENQEKLARVLVRIKETAAAGVLKPKLGYAKRPMTKCWACDGLVTADDDEQCGVCHGVGKVPTAQPPASILGKPKQGGGEAKSQYMIEGVQLVERTVEVEILCCETCGAEDVGVKHRCPLPKQPKRQRRKSGDHAVVAADLAAQAGAGAPARPVAALVSRVVALPRYFWQLPFNPDAPAQVIAYITQQGVAAPVDRKKLDAEGKAKKTTNKQAMKRLAKEHGGDDGDPFYQLLLDWKAVQKVDSTYAVGTLRRLDKDDRVHPEYTPKPSTLRDSCVDPNLTNVVADKTGPESLAGGFRRCVVSRDGVPPGVTQSELDQWSQRWAN